MELHLQGKVALVTGGGQGVGRRICLELAGEGVSVVVNDYFLERAQSVQKEIEDAGGQALAVQADIGDAGQVERMFALARERFGDVDILVNNAGVTVARRTRGGMPPTFMEMPVEDWKEVVDLNVYGVMNCCRSALPGMQRRGGGKIVNIMSEAGRVGEARLAVYSGAKAAMLGFAKAIAQEHGRDCINVNTIALGAVSHEGIANGPLHPSATPETDDRLKKMLGAYPIARGLGRLSRPEDISGVVTFLASDRAAFITGQSLGVSGGYVML
ncbi:short-chain dehydrogenase [Cupriavidus taiwanensis]|uniref:SDR family NAD(P)-dependent oxidoreductase n=1 Tax=Cupriavidus taiwanensis TaxID=164546 RepID=UPI001F02BD07|nr:SDR family NAD(P)-dependent oxidoreductase [Cupriavidus taiwanensis]ULX50721.1 short-chain dehydrogenase [Cupriavidus taiwanensis]